MRLKFFANTRTLERGLDKLEKEREVKVSFLFTPQNQKEKR